MTAARSKISDHLHDDGGGGGGGDSGWAQTRQLPNALMNSTGIGKMIVEFFSEAICPSVCR